MKSPRTVMSVWSARMVAIILTVGKTPAMSPDQVTCIPPPTASNGNHSIGITPHPTRRKEGTSLRDAVRKPPSGGFFCGWPPARPAEPVGAGFWRVLAHSHRRRLERPRDRHGARRPVGGPDGREHHAPRLDDSPGGILL